ncbi:hypothetical protein EJB05_46765, partial [Eragrostis curvula]
MRRRSKAAALAWLPTDAPTAYKATSTSTSPHLTSLHPGPRQRSRKSSQAYGVNCYLLPRRSLSSRVHRRTEERGGDMEARYVKAASRFFLAGNCDRRGHFLDACFLCKRDITCDRHIFMYKGDAAFCSDDCRQDQMDMDAALKAAARRHRMLRRTSSNPPTATARRRPTIADIAAHAHLVSG